MLKTTSSWIHSGRLLQVLSLYERVAIVTHDNPDPDAIATGWALLTLIEETMPMPASLYGGGAIIRAENRYMVDLLSPPIQLVEEIPHDDRVGVVLVDCSPGTSNHLVTRQGIRPVGVIDHHLNGKRPADIPFLDIRPDVAASATIAADYLQEQGIEPGDKLATAMLYAIRTETRGHETHHTDLDRSVVVWLTEWADPALLAEIECAPLSRDYFSDLTLALQCTVVYGDTAVCLPPRAEGAEVVGELADLLIRCRSIRRVLSGAVVDGDLLVSVRTSQEGDNAAWLVQSVLEGLGSGGGHSHRAGGKIPRVTGDRAREAAIKTELRRRWEALCGVSESDGTPLISRREIIENL